MQPPTPPTWSWSTWERRARARAAQYERARAFQLEPYVFFGYKKDPSTGQYVKSDHLGKLIDEHLFSGRRQMPTVPPAWFHDPYRDHNPWRIPDLKVYPDQSIPHFRAYEPSIVLSESGGSGVGVGAGAGGAGQGAAQGAGGAGWVHGARGWAAGGAVLLLLVLLVRAAENCLHKKLFKAIYMHTNVGAGHYQHETMRGQYIYHPDGGVRRQDSEEWSRPNVTATSQAPATEVIPVRDSHVSDPPPPYTECAAHKRDSPPPPYSACAAALPAVHYSRRTHGAESRVNIDLPNNENQSDVTNTTVLAGNTAGDTMDTGSEIVFNSGRIVATDDAVRLELHDDDLGGMEVRRTDTGPKETVAFNVSPERSLVV